MDGEPQAGEIQPITITVRSEANVLIPGATVVVSGTTELLRGETNEAGYAVLRTFPPDARPYVLTVEKIGYLGATTRIPVGMLRLYLWCCGTGK